MALHRLESLVTSLTNESEEINGENDNDDRKQLRTLWPRNTPCAVVERASCPDQRVIRSTLEHVCAAVEEEGSRPPGLLVLGWSCQVLHKPGGPRWIVEDGFRGLDDLGMEKELDMLKELGESNSAGMK
jgi:uroporphyrin-III C-methyltransferase